MLSTSASCKSLTQSFVQAVSERGHENAPYGAVYTESMIITRVKTHDIFISFTDMYSWNKNSQRWLVVNSQTRVSEL